MAADAQPGAQAGKLSGDGAVRWQDAGRVQRGDEVTGPVAEGAQVTAGGGRLSGVVLPRQRRGGENPGGHGVEQELTEVARDRGHGDVRRRHRVLRVQVDAGGGLAVGRGQVEPADLVRRVRAQLQLA